MHVFNNNKIDVNMDSRVDLRRRDTGTTELDVAILL